METERISRKEREYLAHREEILSAAEKVFAAKGFFPTTVEYFKNWGLTAERLSRARRNVLVMHPGPMNRGVEISSDVADGLRSVILEQVTNGLAVRMAVLYLLAGVKG